MNVAGFASIERIEEEGRKNLESGGKDCQLMGGRGML